MLSSSREPCRVSRAFLSVYSFAGRECLLHDTKQESSKSPEIRPGRAAIMRQTDLNARRTVERATAASVSAPDSSRCLHGLRRPATHKVALRVSHVGLVSRRHRARRHATLQYPRRARFDLLTGVEHHTARCRAERQVGRTFRMTYRASPVDDVPGILE